MIAVPPAPHAPARAAVARRLFERAVQRVDGLEVELPGGELLRAEAASPRMHIVRDDLFHRLGVSGNIGFGEAYMAGDWEADDLAGVLTAFAGQLGTLVPRPLQRLRRLYEAHRPESERNTLEGAATNISRHYDLSNDLFELFLDEHLAYSCAVFRPGDSLEAAQRRKFEAVCQLADLRAKDRVLEIGGGFGSLAIHAARTYGCRVTTATISRNQALLAQRRVAAAGVGDLVEVTLSDYRALRGRYDALLSVEMIEAVGDEYLPTFFAACHERLRPGARLSLQAITMPHDRYLASRHAYTWIHKYIFPGGLIPSPQRLREAAAGARFRVDAAREIGADYATTLRAWRERFLARRDELRRLGFDRLFERTWCFYLAYCEAGFRSGALGVEQLALERGRP